MILDHIFDNIKNHHFTNSGLMNGACSELLFLHLYLENNPKHFGDFLKKKISNYYLRIRPQILR